MPLTKLGNGYYLFGTRKIFIKAQDDQLSIRAGGGYIGINEFLEEYSESEFSKINRLMERNELANMNKFRL